MQLLEQAEEMANLYWSITCDLKELANKLGVPNEYDDVIARLDADHDCHFPMPAKPFMKAEEYDEDGAPYDDTGNDHDVIERLKAIEIKKGIDIINAIERIKNNTDSEFAGWK